MICMYGRIIVSFVFAGFVIGSISGCHSTDHPSNLAAQMHVSQGHQFSDQGLSNSALASFALAIAENPKIVDAHLGMGNVYRQRGRYELAERSFTTATHIAPNNYEGHYYLGLVLHLGNKLEDAARVYLRALVIRPESYEANYHLGGAYLQLGRPNDAAQYVTRATDLNPESQEAWANQGVALSLLGQYEEAVEAFRHANELGDTQTPVLIGLADALLRLERYERAINVLQSLIRHEPTSLVHERMGYCLFKSYRFEDALTSYRAALSLESDDMASLNGLGVCLMTLYIQSGRRDSAYFDEAMKSWRNSLILEGNQPRIIDLISRYQTR